MRRLAIIAACLLASAGLILLLAPSPASALTAPGLQKGAAQDNGLLLARHGGRGFRGGHGFRGHAFRGHAFSGHRGFRGGRVYGFRGGRHWGHRRGWRGPGWGLALGAAALPYYYGGWGNCPLVRRTVWTPYGYRVRWVRRCW